MNCKLCGDTFEDGDTAIAGICGMDLEKLITGAVKDKKRKDDAEAKAEAGTGKLALTEETVSTEAS